MDEKNKARSCAQYVVTPRSGTSITVSKDGVEREVPTIGPNKLNPAFAREYVVTPDGALHRLRSKPKKVKGFAASVSFAGPSNRDVKRRRKRADAASIIIPEEMVEILAKEQQNR